MKVYSICAEMLIISGKWSDAITIYTRIISIAKAAQYSQEAKMYSYKQIAFCYIKQSLYQNAIHVLMKLLQMAWCE